MRRSVLPGLLLCCAAAAAADEPETAAAEPPPPEDHALLHVTVRLEEHGGSYGFALEGASGLPEGTRLTARILFEKRRPAPEWKRREGGPETQIDEVDVAEGAVAVAGGTFTAALGRFGKKPFSGTYAAWVRADPSDQPPAVRSAWPAGAGTVTVRKPMALGTADDYFRETTRSKREAAEDLTALMDLHADLDRRFVATREAGWNAAAWQAWASEWKMRLGVLRGRNDARFEADIYWFEWRAKYFLGVRIDTLEDLEKACAEFLSTGGGDGKALARLQETSLGLKRDFGHDQEMMGLGPSLDAGPSRAALQAARDRLSEAVAAGSESAAADSALRQAVIALGRAVGDVAAKDCLALARSAARLGDAGRSTGERKSDLEAVGRGLDRIGAQIQRAVDEASGVPSSGDPGETPK